MANDFLLKTYDPKLVIVNFGGTTVTGFVDGSFVEITGEDNFESVEGADGSEDRVNKNKNGKDVTITISQTSITNDVFTGIHTLDRETNAGKLPLTIKDLNGTSLFFSAQAYIKKIPDVTYSNGIESRQWILRAPQAVMFVGSNL